jgi:gamma-glutamylcyclotransferase (GGCT)/AIG2-like uncharacterized protein YtfP
MAKQKTIAQLIRKCTLVFNRWIRNRDKDQPCISCGRYVTLQAGHFYSAGHYPGLRFDPDNVHGQCLRCNMYLSGNLIEYQNGLLGRIGEQRLAKLCFKADQYKKQSYRWNRFFFRGDDKEIQQ